MATYIQGVTDYIPEIQQYQPDFDFFNTMLEKRQSLYDEAREKIADVYNSVLNNPMLRESDIKKRDEFFKQIDDDIKKVSKMDLSLRQNQQQALHVFSQLLDDKNIAHDMVFTKKANEALKYGDYLREKGDKGYWSGMSQNIQYDMLGYKNADDETAMQMNAPKYVKRVDIMGEAMEKVKDMKFDVTEESPYMITGYDENGNPKYEETKWIIKRKNGELVRPYIQSMLTSEYATRGDVMDYYRERAKNERLNWATQHADEFGSFDEANKAYIQQAGEIIRQADEKLSSQISDVADNKRSQITSTKKAIEEANENGDQTSAEYYNNKLSEYVAELQNMEASKDFATMQNNQVSYGGFTADNIDSRSAFAMLEAEIDNAAKNASMIGYEMSYSVNPYAKMQMEQNFELTKLQKEYDYKIALEKFKKKQENEMLPNDFVDLGYLDGGTSKYDPDERGGKVIDEYHNITTNGTIAQRKAIVLDDAFDELKKEAESDTSLSWKAKQVLTGMILDYLPEEEKTELTNELGGRYDKLYERLKDTNIDFRNANPIFVYNAYEKIRNNWDAVNDTRAKHLKNISLLSDNDKMISEAFGGTKRDMSAAVEMLDDKDRAIVRAYMGLGPTDRYEDWDGSFSGYDEYFHKAQLYSGVGGLTISDINKYWENGNAKKLAGEQYDKIATKTQYAIIRGNSNPGVDGKAARSSGGTVRNNVNDPNRANVSKILKLAYNSRNSVVLEGMVPSADATENEELRDYLIKYASNLDNLYDGKSKASYNYGISIHPIAVGDDRMYGLSIINPLAKEDEADYKGITIAIPKEELRGRNISMFDATDKRPYDNMLNFARGPIAVPELRNPSLDVYNNGKDIMIGADQSGNIYAIGRSFCYDPYSGEYGVKDFSDRTEFDFSEFNSADDAVEYMMQLINNGAKYYNKK